MLSVTLEKTLGAIFPKRCEICHKSASPLYQGALCENCGVSIRLLGEPLREKALSDFDERPEFNRALCCTAYEGSMRELVHHYKFENKKHLHSYFSKLMLSFLRSLEKPVFFDSICSVPLEWKRFKERGFNQSELLSRSISDSLGVAHLSRFLKRKDSASPQFLLDKNSRKSNVKNVFRVSDKEVFKDRNLLLIDDILTTGHTASECSKVLKNSGASSVTLLALCRSL